LLAPNDLLADIFYRKTNKMAKSTGNQNDFGKGVYFLHTEAFSSTPG